MSTYQDAIKIVESQIAACEVSIQESASLGIMREHKAEEHALSTLLAILKDREEPEEPAIMSHCSACCPRVHAPTGEEAILPTPTVADLAAAESKAFQRGWDLAISRVYTTLGERFKRAIRVV
jgi:hypothetical protein